MDNGAYQRLIRDPFPVRHGFYAPDILFLKAQRHRLSFHRLPERLSPRHLSFIEIGIGFEFLDRLHDHPFFLVQERRIEPGLYLFTHGRLSSNSVSDETCFYRWSRGTIRFPAVHKEQRRHIRRFPPPTSPDDGILLPVRMPAILQDAATLYSLKHILETDPSLSHEGFILVFVPFDGQFTIHR